MNSKESCPDPVANDIVIAKGDSGATKHYWRPKDKDVLNDLKSFQGANVTLPNNVSIQSTEKGNIPFSEKLSEAAKDASVLPGLESSSLVSLGQLCDDDCEILLNKKSLFVIKENELILEGYRNQNDLLWDIPVSNPDILKSTHLTNPNGAGLYSVIANTKAYKPISRQRKNLQLIQTFFSLSTT